MNNIVDRMTIDMPEYRKAEQVRVIDYRFHTAPYGRVVPARDPLQNWNAVGRKI